MKRDNIGKIIFYVFITIWAGSILYRMLISCIWGIPSFDGAMNLQVPFQMLKNGKYMTTYDGGTIFDSRIQTRLPVLLPIYFLWSIFGISSVSALIVNALYIMALLFVSFKICQELNVLPGRIWVILAIITVIPEFWGLSMGIYGETPTLALFLVSVYFLIKAEKNGKIRINIFLSGIFFSLAALNKTVILIAFPSFGVVFIYKLILEKSIKFKEFILWPVSLLIPFVLEEFYHMSQIGDIYKYLVTMKEEIFSIGKQAGVVSGYSDTANIFSKFWEHMNILNHVSVIFNVYSMTAILVFLFVLWLFNVIKLKKMSFFSIVVLTMFSYFGWWLLITPTGKAWYRRIFIGVILLFLVIGIFMDKILKKIHIKKEISYAVIVGIVFMISIFHINKSIWTDKTLKKDHIEMANEIGIIRSENPNAKFYGYGWYQAPIISFFAEESFYNLLNDKIQNDNAYLVIDGASTGEGEADIILRNFDTKLCIKNKSGSLYKLNEIDANTYDFESELISVDAGGVKENVYNANEEYDGIVGVSAYESSNGARWGTTNVELLLNNVGKTRLCLNLHIVAYNQMNSIPIMIYVLIDNEIVDTIEIVEDGEIKYCIEGENIEKEGIRDIRLFTNSYVKTSQDGQQLAYLLKSVQFVD